MTTEENARACGIAVVTAATGRTPLTLRRFTTGLDHFVFEALFADEPPLVVRIGTRRHDMAAGARLQRQLQALGVSLPAIIAEDFECDLPCVVMERLAGTDLGNTIATLSSAKLNAIAQHVAQAQAIVARIPSAGRYGYAAKPEDAPHTTWSQVVDTNLARSRQWIGEAKLFNMRAADLVEAQISACRAELDALPAIPFLHDTTTKNVIVTDTGDFSGIVDVDDLCFGDPRYAPALTLAALIAHDGPIGYVDSWMKYAGHRDDRLFRLYVALFLVNFMAEHGQAFNGTQSPSNVADRNRLLAAFESAVCAMNS